MLPIDFQNRMKQMLGNEYDEFIASYDKPEFHGLRINTLKTDMKDFISKMTYNFKNIPWVKEGLYYEDTIRPGKHPYHEAGVYYIQEPSAMAPAEYLDINPGDTVLDLCAAPGGKSTQIASKLNGSGLLISNEIHPARAKILSENIERMGIKNAIVTNESPDSLTTHFHEFFDKIMVDAPCSGEGMFRKNNDACNEWSLENVELCAARSIGILDCAAYMLKPGGKMVFSTCTFAPLENEDTITNFLNSHSDFHLVISKKYDGMSDGSLNGTIRLWPHRLNGEGHFLAVLIKNRIASDNSSYKPLQGLSEKDCKEYIDFCRDNLTIKLDGLLIKFGDQLYILPHNSPSLNGLKVLRPGLHLGTILKNRFEPSHSLALSLKSSDVKNSYNLSVNDKNVFNYINGQTFECDGEKGWYLITVDNYSIGWGKLSSGIMKNHYPKGLRKNLS